MSGFDLTLTAMAGAPGGSGQGQGNSMVMIVWIVLMLGLFYFMMIRPQQRKEKERRKMMDAIKTGDRVIFAGGLIGSVTNVKDHTFAVKIADNTKVEVLKASVTRVLQKDEELGPATKE